MAKVRFYCDVPEYRSNPTSLYASTQPCGVPVTGAKRVAFDVELPPELLKSHDISGPVVRAIELIDEEPTP